MAEQEIAEHGPAQEGSLDELASLLDKTFKPRPDMVSETQLAVQTLARVALEGTAVADKSAVKVIRELIAGIDETLTAQINEILHHKDFQKLEGSWRGLKHMLGRTATGADLKIKVMAVSKEELRKELEKTDESEFDQNEVFKKIYNSGLDLLGGHPYASIVADYHFDNSLPDVQMLHSMARIAGAAHAPMIAGGSPSLFNLDDWRELPDKKDLANIQTTAPYDAWRTFREDEDSRYVGLAMPRFLSRTPYGKDNPVDAFAFEETVDTDDSTQFCWSNAAYAMGANIARAFKQHGWCSNIRGVESGGIVERLPTYTFPTDKGGYASQCPTEVAVGARREKELSDLGLMPLVHMQNSNMAAFISAQSLHKPAKYEGEAGEDATSNAALGARLPYMFACCRFAHYLKSMVYSKIGSSMEQEDLQRWLSGWIQGYVLSGAGTSDEAKARRPLARAEVSVESDPEDPGHYHATFHLRPHFQLEGTNVSLRLVSRLPSER